MAERDLYPLLGIQRDNRPWYVSALTPDEVERESRSGYPDLTHHIERIRGFGIATGMPAQVIAALVAEHLRRMKRRTPES